MQKAKINVQANLLEISYTKRENSESLSAGDKLIAEEKYYQEFHELPPRSIWSGSWPRLTGNSDHNHIRYIDYWLPLPPMFLLVLTEQSA